MKTISMEYKEYQNELKDKYSEGYGDATNEILVQLFEIYRDLHLKCDKDSAADRLREMFETRPDLLKEVAKLMNIELLIGPSLE